MVKILILDDDHSRHRQFSKKYATEDLKHVYTSYDCIQLLKVYEYDYVFLDHDLGGKQMVKSGDGTGYEVAEWLSNNPDRQPKISVVLHSLNPIGRKNMCNVLKSSNIPVIASPFLWRT
jgi:CheY-like chemotaxis protein